MNEADILVLGGGPAGGAVAIGLARMGYAVTLVGEPRPFDAVEGASERAVQGMRAAGFHQALAEMATETPRQVTWNGETSAANTEFLIPRQPFDRALLRDIADQGVNVIEGRIHSCHEHEGIFRAMVASENEREQLVAAPFLVEARGRSAPAAGVPRVKGTATVSLLQYWQGPEAAPRTAVQSFADGWAWMAMRADGRRYLQLTVDVASAQLPPKQQLGEWCHQQLMQLEQAQPFIRDARPTGSVYARTSSPVLCQRSAGDNWIRVGDAAMAVDPLSGNGIFQALSSALQAPAVVNTLIQQPEKAALAQQFHEARVEGLFYRFARIGRDFYAQEQQWPERPFWKGRCQWPDSQPMHQSVSPEQVVTAMRPVVENGLITQAQVVVTPDQPLGIWHLNGLPLAPLLDAVRQAPERSPADVLSDHLEGEQGRLLAGWMQQQGWLYP
ncbi:tryptophan 7-halogenase [Marinobacterium sp. AK62]|uniref:Tryptophan 7-halogenase n=1 Tax=Marinobacterium alkalitolerans TaxID=1542925 RepID=A0ABS3Z9C2_9GAMM|nr:lycopene cyclase family protein [Marinobacterium alkalitolerans]MBP0048303.1 tryptophan 7-halogenase [Marinobacterium alkalitolerans]